MQRALLGPVAAASLVSATLSIVTMALLGAPSPRAVQAQGSVIRAERVEIVDAQGMLRMRLGVEPTGAANLVVYDPAGQLRLAMGLADVGQPVLGFWDPAGQPRLGMGIAPDGSPAIGIRDARGEVVWQAPPVAPAPANQ